ncbi:MAG: hypothetical protein IT312_04295 [Anaerolineales bacterium]|nr:hypothetical protein [Anaerolineales bacterium]
MTKRIFISADHGMAIAGLKPHAQHMEALRADERVGFSRLPRTEVVVEFIETQDFSPPNHEVGKMFIVGRG